METTIIEKLDKMRYNALIWMTLGFGLFFGSMILTEFISYKLIMMIIRFLGIIGWLFYLRSLFLMFKLGKQIKTDVKLKNALNDELHILYMHKTYAIGFWSFLLLIVSFFLISFFTELSMRISMEIILYLGVLTFLISALIYNRN